MTDKMNKIFFCTSRFICVSLLCTVSAVQGVFSPLLPPPHPPLSAQLHSHHSHTPFLTPRPLPYCSGPGRNPHFPVSEPPPPSYSYQPGARRTERKKEKKKNPHLSVRDYKELLRPDHVCPPSIGGCFPKATKWELLQGEESYRQ